MNFEQKNFNKQERPAPEMESLVDLLELKQRLEAKLAIVNKKIEDQQGGNFESREYTPLYKANKKGDAIIEAEDGEPSLFTVKKDVDGKLYLFLSESIRQASAATNGNIKLFFELENKNAGQYKLTKPAELKKDYNQTLVVRTKGKIEF